MSVPQKANVHPFQMFQHSRCFPMPGEVSFAKPLSKFVALLLFLANISETLYNSLTIMHAIGHHEAVNGPNVLLSWLHSIVMLKSQNTT